jgi:hypothetical protein
VSWRHVTGFLVGASEALCTSSDPSATPRLLGSEGTRILGEAAGVTEGANQYRPVVHDILRVYRSSSLSQTWLTRKNLHFISILVRAVPLEPDNLCNPSNALASIEMHYEVNGVTDLMTDCVIG